MAKKAARSSRSTTERKRGRAKPAPGPDDAKLRAALRRHIRARGEDYLKDPNITSVGVGLKNGDGPVSLQFTVGRKIESAPETLGAALETLGTRMIPKTITVDGFEIPTDVIERGYEPSFRIVGAETLDARRVRSDPLRPGISVGNARVHKDAGTVGLIVYDRLTGAPCILTNWHVAHGKTGAIGDAIVQPGTFDDNNIAGNFCGNLLRSHLGPAGDCALVRVRARDIDRAVQDLGVTPLRLAEVELGDRLVKSGRTTGVTHGIVRRTDVLAKMDFGPGVGEHAVGCFEIGLDPERPPADGEISKGGDSGSAWLIAQNGKPTDIFAGLHFAGEAEGNDDEHALACYALSVQKKLDFLLELPPELVVEHDGLAVDVPRAGYDPDFLGIGVPMPGMSTAIKRDAVNFGRTQTIPYTHFSVCLSAARRMARFVAWNVDGARKVVLPRHGFRLDPRVDPKHQHGDELYRDNALDRGHIARRADLAWGSVAEADQANRDSFFFTNVAPQHERFNQSSRKGLWGELENLVLEQAQLQGIRVSAMGGPVFDGGDAEYRGARLPRSFWKLVAYLGLDGRLRVAVFVLSQADLVTDLETLDLDPFRIHQVTVSELSARTTLDFSALEEADLLLNPDLVTSGIVTESLVSGAERMREIRTVADLLL